MGLGTHVWESDSFGSFSAVLPHHLTISERLWWSRCSESPRISRCACLFSAAIYFSVSVLFQLYHQNPTNKALALTPEASAVQYLKTVSGKVKSLTKGKGRIRNSLAEESIEWNGDFFPAQTVLGEDLCKQEKVKWHERNQSELWLQFPHGDLFTIVSLACSSLVFTVGSPRLNQVLKHGFFLFLAWKQVLLQLELLLRLLDLFVWQTLK